MEEWTPRLAEVSRRLRSRADAILGAVWFMPQDGLPALAARVACLGRVPGRVAAALFAPQHPERVATAVDGAWRDHDPGQLLAARRSGATAYLARALGDEPAASGGPSPSSGASSKRRRLPVTRCTPGCGRSRGPGPRSVTSGERAT